MMKVFDCVYLVGIEVEYVVGLLFDYFLDFGSVLEFFICLRIFMKKYFVMNFCFEGYKLSVKLEFLLFIREKNLINDLCLTF